MTRPAFATHDVFNQSPPFEDVDLYSFDRPLVEAVAAFGGAAAQKELADFGRHWGAAEMAARGRAANENTPKLRSFDSRGTGGHVASDRRDSSAAGAADCDLPFAASPGIHAC